MPKPSDDSTSPPAVARSLHLVFTDTGAFRAEYARNLSKGGAFVPTDQRFALREVVEVWLEAAFAGEKLVLSAEVVHCLPPNGVAVQFLDAAPELRSRLEAILALAGPDELGLADPDEGLEAELTRADPLDESDLAGLDFELGSPDEIGAAETREGGASLEGFEATAVAGESDPNERTFAQRADRAPVRVPVRVRGPTGIPIHARTRDLSATGLLLSVDGEELPVGRDVQLEITHPGTGAALEVGGRVVRHLEGPGVVPAVAVQMKPGSERQAVERFIDDVRRVDEEQRRGGIRGPLEELGAAGLLQMFAALSRCGTLLVASGAEEGTVAFEDGQLVSAQVGSVRGAKALARIFAWREGFFEFRAHVDPGPREIAPEPMEAAIFEALRLVDESNRAAPSLAPGTRFAVRRERLASLAEPLAQTEQAVLELATAGFTLRRILDVIPESDAQIRGAITRLLERGLIRPA
jgi:type IV pilus assembly protein PilZ